MKFRPEKASVFKQEASLRVLSGKWGIKEIDYLHEHKLQYHLTKEDIKLFLIQAYQYAYVLAMEDGIITDLEMSKLQKIRNFFQQIHPNTNRYELQHIKDKLTQLNYELEKSHNVEKNYREELKLDEINEVKNMNKLPKYPRPKLTPWKTNNYFYG